MSTTDTSSNSENPHQFEIVPGPNGPISVSGRAEAVERAKALSADMPRPVRVERMDGKVKMEFRSGGIVRYRRRTR
ncbi:MAG: hypothetical protein JJ863_01595 [Deltaproteobacteria bacterium]|nr:hypothetical protein [Deltaproteobacteria bacterium]